MCYRETVTEAGLTPKFHGDGVGRKGLHPVKEVASLSDGVVLKKQSVKKKRRTSLVAQWLRIRLPTQGHGFEPRSGKIPRATEQLSPCNKTIEPAS